MLLLVPLKLSAIQMIPMIILVTFLMDVSDSENRLHSRNVCQCQPKLYQRFYRKSRGSSPTSDSIAGDLYSI